MLPLSAADNDGQNRSKKCRFHLLKQEKIKKSTPVSREGNRAGSIQMDTLDAVKSSRRQQTAGGREMCAWSIASFWLKGWRAKTTCSGHNPLATNGLTKEGMSARCMIFHSIACAGGSVQNVVTLHLQKLEITFL